KPGTARWFSRSASGSGGMSRTSKSNMMRSSLSGSAARGGVFSAPCAPKGADGCGLGELSETDSGSGRSRRARRARALLVAGRPVVGERGRFARRQPPEPGAQVAGAVKEHTHALKLGRRAGVEDRQRAGLALEQRERLR